MQTIREPLVFEPIIKQARWGGRALATSLQKTLGDQADYAESWEISHQTHATSVVSTGRFQGITLDEIMQAQGTELLGYTPANNTFPLLLKYLDANDWLSLQVHPNDAQAAEFQQGMRGKTEAWVILDASADSQICAGLKPDVDRQKLAEHLANGTVRECLHFETVQPGDCVLIPAGTVHALGPGLVLAEIQQQSDMTFRLHDWGRMGSDGKPRELHIDQSLACIDYSRGPVSPVPPVIVNQNNEQFEQLVRCPYFSIRRYCQSSDFAIATHGRFRALMVLAGKGSLNWDAGDMPISKGITLLIPATLDSVRIRPDEPLTLLEISTDS